MASHARRATCSTPGLATAWLALIATVPAAGAQSEDTGQQHLPTVTIELVGGPTVELGHSKTVRITIDDVDGDLVDARMTLAPPFLAMEPIRRATPPVVRTLHWFPDKWRSGRQPIVVTASESIGAAARVTGRATLEVIGGIRPRVQLLDVDGDDRAEIVAASPWVDDAGQDLGALVVFHDLDAAAVGHEPSRFVSSAPTAGTPLGYDAPFQADLDHDGRLDLLAATDANGGTIEVWYGRSGFQDVRASDARLMATAPVNFSFVAHSAFLLRDVTGDGIEDLVASSTRDSTVQSDAGALFVFAGGARAKGAVAPTATLRRATSFANDRLAEAGTVGFVVADVTGDALLDVIAVAPTADWASTQTDRGVAVVFAGGPSLVGNVAPVAELRAPSASNGLKMGEHSTGPGAWTVDVTGDGVRDVIVAAPKRGGGGALYVWAGGATLTGLPAATATLLNSSGKTDDYLGIVGTNYLSESGPGVHFADVTGDGQVDVVAGASLADLGTSTYDAGVVYVWTGGAALTGTPAITATLGTTLAQRNGRLASGTNGLRVEDLTGDGIDDVMTIDSDHDVNGVADVGALHLWAGGAAMSGTPAPLATLFDPAETGASFLGRPSGWPWNEGVRLTDVTGDGVAELVVQATGATVNGQSNAGAIHLFAVGSALSGNVAPFATLVASRPHVDDKVSSCYTRTGPDLVVADVTGDGLRDIVASGTLSRQGHPGCGGVVVWEGGPSLAGTVVARAEFFGSQTNECFAFDTGMWQCADATNDTILDLVVATPETDSPTHTRVGSAVLLEGGPSLRGVLAPRATLLYGQPSDHDGLFSTSAALFRVLDLDGDGRDDLVIGAPDVRHYGQSDAGMVLWFPSCEPIATGFGANLFPPGFAAHDRFGGG